MRWGDVGLTEIVRSISDRWHNASCNEERIDFEKREGWNVEVKVRVTLTIFLSRSLDRAVSSLYTCSLGGADHDKAFLLAHTVFP